MAGSTAFIWRRAARRLAIVLLLLIGIVVALTALLLLGLSSPPGQALLRRVAVQKLRELVPGLDVGELRFRLPGAITLREVAVRDAGGHRVAQIEELRALVHLPALLDRRVMLESLVLVRPRVDVHRTRDGRVNLVTLVRAAPGPPSEEPGRPPWALEVRALKIEDGGAMLKLGSARPWVVRGLELAAAVQVREPELRADFHSLSFTLVPWEKPPLRVALRGQVRREATRVAGDLRASVRGLLPSAGALHVNLVASGPPREVRLGAVISAERAGAVVLSGWIGSPLRYQLRADLLRVRPSAFLSRVRGTLQGTIRLRGEGRPLAQGSRAEADLLLTRSSVAGIEIEEQVLRLELQGVTWRLREGRARLRGAELAFQGHGRGARLALTATAVFRSRESLAALAGRVGGRGRLRAEVRGVFPRALAVRAQLDASELATPGLVARGVHLQGQAQGLPAAPRGTLTLTASSLRLGRGVVYRGVSLQASGSRRRATVSASASGYGSRAALKAAVDLAPGRFRAVVSRLELVHPDLSLRLVSPTTITWRAGRSARLSPTRLGLFSGEVTVAGSWRQRAKRLEARLEGERLALRGLGRVSGRVALSVDRRSAKLSARAALGGAESRLALEAKLPLRYRRGSSLPQVARTRPLAVRLSARELPLGRVLRATSRSAPSAGGLLQLDARAGGTLADPRLEVRSALRGGRLGDLTGLHVLLEGRADEESISLQLTADRGRQRLVQLRGRVAAGLRALRRPLAVLPDVPVRVSVELPGLDLRSLEQAGTASVNARGLVRLGLGVEGTLHRPQAELHLSAEDVRLEQRRVDSLSARVRWASRESSSQLDGRVDVWGAPAIRFRGETDLLLGALLSGQRPSDTPLRAEVELSSLPLAAMAAVAGTVPETPVGRSVLRGALTGGATISGTWGVPRLAGFLQLADPRALTPSLRRMAARVQLGDGRFAAQVLVRQVDGGSLDAQLDYDARRPAPLMAGLEARRVQLATLGTLWPSWGGIGGQLSATVEAQGPLAQPTLVGEVDVTGGRLERAGLPPLRDARLRLRLQPGLATLSELALSLEGGTLEVRGTAALDGLRPRRFELDARAGEVSLERWGVSKSTFKGEVRIRGSYSSPGGLWARVDVPTGTVRVRQLPTGGGRRLHPTDALPDVRFVESLDQLPRPARPGSRPRAGLPVLIQIRAGELHLRGAEVNTDVAVDLTLRGVPGSPVRIEGALVARGGEIDILGRSYEIDLARVSFPGRAPAEPQLDIRLTRQFPEAMVTLRLTGPAPDPELELSSDPPIFDRSQIIALIATGQATAGPEQAGPASGLGLASVVLQLLVGQLTQRIAPGVGLDLLRVGQVERTALPGAREGLGGQTELEAGKYITERLYVAYRRVFGAELNQNANEGKLELRISARWSLDALFGDAGVGGIDLFWSYSY